MSNTLVKSNHAALARPSRPAQPVSGGAAVTADKVPMAPGAYIVRPEPPLPYEPGEPKRIKDGKTNPEWLEWLIRKQAARRPAETLIQDDPRDYSGPTLNPDGRTSSAFLEKLAAEMQDRIEGREDRSMTSILADRTVGEVTDALSLADAIFDGGQDATQWAIEAIADMDPSAADRLIRGAVAHDSAYAAAALDALDYALDYDDALRARERYLDDVALAREEGVQNWNEWCDYYQRRVLTEVLGAWRPHGADEKRNGAKRRALFLSAFDHGLGQPATESGATYLDWHNAAYQMTTDAPVWRLLGYSEIAEEYERAAAELGERVYEQIAATARALIRSRQLD